MAPKELAGDDEEWPEDDEPIEHGQHAMTLEVAPIADAGAGSECDVMVSVLVPDGGKRPAAHVCCVVDISGSMDALATYETDGVVKNDGMTVLDIVKHAVKTVIHTLKEGDRFALVAFDDQVELAFPLSAMTPEGRTKAVAALEGLQPRGRTNIWGGVLGGMEALQASAFDCDHMNTILLLTDGLPNISPPRGHVPELQDYIEKRPGFSFQLNTFGFGYSLDSELLLDLATEGNGTYAFIPDAVIVGTVFVNSIANTLSTRTQMATLHLTPEGGAEFVGSVRGSYHVMEASWGRVVNLGPLQFGQSREIVVPMRIPAGVEPYLEAVVTYPTRGGVESRASIKSVNRTAAQTALMAAARSEVVSIGYEVVRDASAGRGKSAQQALNALVARVAGYSQYGDPMLLALKADVEGRMSKAMKGKERFNRWGKHYIRALMRAHQLQVCTNFMDAGLQLYGGQSFLDLRDEGDTIFLTLPKPKPSKAAGHIPTGAPGVYVPAPPRPSQAGYQASSPAPAARARSPSPDMNTYYAGSGGG